MADALAKKVNVRTVLKNVIATTLQEAQGYLNEDTTNETIEFLLSYQDTLKRKINAVKTLEDKILELENDPAIMEAILTKSTKFEIENKGKLNLITKFTATNTRKKETDVKTRSKQPIDTIKLRKLEIAKFGDDPTTWQQFHDSFTGAIHNSVSLTNVEKFNYLRSFLVDEALHCISGLPLTNDNYENALKLLKDRYGNNQIIISAHMNALVKLPKVRNNDIRGLRKFYDDIESNIRSLSSLGIETIAHGTLIATLILEKFPQEIKLIVAINVKESWELTKILDIVNQKLGAREACTVKTAEDSKSGSDNYEGFSYTGSSLHINSQYRIQGQKFANIKCLFCGQVHWSL